MCDSGDAVVEQINHFAQNDLGEHVEEEWPLGETPEQHERPRRTDGALPKPLGDDELLYFIPGPGTGLTHWVFHPFDVDYFPSVPHGHFQGRPQPKLDAYLGWVYQGSKQISRETRQSIILLWNEDKFRALASTAIQFYLNQFPHYTGWRVSKPKVLPRRRTP
jgi:hypothetical protein